VDGSRLNKDTFSALCLASAVIGSAGCLGSSEELEEQGAEGEDLSAESPDELISKSRRRFNGLDEVTFWEVPGAGGVDYDPKDLLRAGPSYTELDRYWWDPLKYVGLCALPAGKTIQVTIHGVDAFEMIGDLGYAGGVDDGNPFNPSNYDDATYTQKLSACVSALANGNGETVPVTLAAATVLGSFSRTDAFNEAGFFGDFFNFGEHNAFVCTADGVEPENLRACKTNDLDTSASCPWIYAGKCSEVCEVVGGRIRRAPARGNSRWCEYRYEYGGKTYTYRFSNPVFVHK
jgi:hypothetical protein